MEVRLTDKGRSAMGWGPDRLTARVSDLRAVVWMTEGMAIQDKGFISLYHAKNPEPEVDPEPETNRPKKENADSRKAKKREKAVTEG